MTRRPWQEASRARALVWLIPCIASWSLIPWLASNIGNLDPFGYLFWSSIVSTTCLLACTFAMGHWPVLRAYSTTDLRRIAALGALGAFAYYALLYWAYGCAVCPDNGPLVVIAQYTWPAFAVLWSALLLRERLTCRVLISLLVGLVAIALGIWQSGSFTASGPSTLPAVLLAAVIFGLYSTLLKRTSYEPYSSMAVGFAVATFLSALGVVQFSTAELMPDRNAAWAVLVNGVLVNGLSYVFWYQALKAAPISFVAPWVALTPLLAAAFAGGAMTFGTMHWVGIGLVLLSVLLATINPDGGTQTRLPSTHSAGFDLVEESR
jgi:drug/metabolite transporter (DMT)-like permease